MDPWWTSQNAGWIGAGVGIVGGLLGSFVGIGAGTLTSSKRGRALLLGTMYASILLGIAALALGGVAILLDQPYHVWYPPLIAGLILTIVIGSLTPIVRMRCRQAEQRQIDAGTIRGAPSDDQV